MSRSVDEVEQILDTILLIFHLNGMALDGNAALAFQIHVVKHLVLGNLNGLGVFQHTVSQSRLAVVYMGNDAEVPYVLHEINSL